MTHSTIPFREISGDRLEEFLAKGYKKRHFFPHRFYFLPKAGPDGLKMAGQCADQQLERFVGSRSLMVAEPPLILFPRNYFSIKLIWHQQHGGRRGQIATANLVIRGANIYGMNYISDLVQRISRETRVQNSNRNRYKGWRKCC